MKKSMAQKGYVLGLVVVIFTVSIASAMRVNDTYTCENGDIELKIRGGFGYWIIVTNNLDVNITATFSINASAIFTNRTFNDSGRLSVKPQYVALYKGFVPGFMRIKATVEGEGETLTRSGFSFARFVIFLS